MKNLMNYFISLGLLFTFGVAHAQIPDLPNKTNKKGQRTGAWVLLYDQNSNPTEVREEAAYYRVINYQQGMVVGPVESYAVPNTLLARIDSLSSEDPEVIEGLVTYFYDDGQVSDYKYYRQGQLDIEKTIAYLHKHLEELDKDINSPTSFYVKTLTKIYQLHYQAGQYAKAEVALVEATEKLLGDVGAEHPVYGSYLTAQATLYRTMGNYDKAERLYRTSYKIRKKAFGGKDPRCAAVVRDLAGVYYFMGKYQEAEQLYLQVVPILKPEGNANKTAYGNYAVALNNFGELYSRMGNYQKAEKLYQQAIQVYEEHMGKEDLDYSNTINNLANLYADQERLEEAEKMYLEAIEMVRETLGENHPNYATKLNNLAWLYENMGQYHRAEELHQRSLEIREKTFGNQHPLYANSLNNLAQIYAKTGREKEAEATYQQALTIVEAALGQKHSVYGKYLSNLANAYLLNQELEKAEPIYQQVNQSLFTQIEDYFPFLSEREKEDFYNNRIRFHFEKFNTFALRRAEQNPMVLEDMYNNQLSTKALLLNASSKWKKRIRNSGDIKLIKAYDTWQTQKAYLHKIYQEPAENHTQAEIDSIEAELNLMEKELTLRSRNFRHIQEQKNHTWKEVQSKLKPGEAALEMIRFREYGQKEMMTDQSDPQQKQYPRYEFTDQVHYAALVVTPETEGHPKLVLLEDGQDLEGKYLKYYRNQIKYRQKDQRSYQMYWQPLKDALEGVKKVYFSPDGVYNQINLNTLQNPETDQYVVDELDVQLLTSSRDLLIEHEQENFNKYALLFGDPNYGLESEMRTQLVQRGEERNADDLLATNETDTFDPNVERSSLALSPLPGTAEEVKNIGEMLQNEGLEPQVFIGDEALEENIKDNFKPRILHIATHGFFRQDVEGKDARFADHNNPLLRSGLMLAGAGHSLKQEAEEEEAEDDDLLGGGFGEPVTEEKSIEDGILTAYEAMNLNLDNTDLVVLSACETGLGEIKNGEGVYGLQRAFKVAGARTIVMSLWNVNDQSTQELMTAFYKSWLKVKDKHVAFEEAQAYLRKKYPDPYHWGAFVIVGE